ncbi:MAG TPA: MBL fold metallo-hydrolase [Vicinamibacterales bacterium]|nr:MBL fold metallo-hydrolase [Vicinamibacterales bacterium]
MRRCTGPLVAAMAMAIVLNRVNVAGQSSAERAEALRHIAAAKQAAGYEVSDLFDHLCSRLLIGSTLPFGRIVPPDNDRDPKRFHTEPVKVFDNLYYVGEKMQHGASPSAWAITTSEGIILIDALFGNSVEDEIVGGLKKMKLDPADLKYVILSHGHADHIGGARFLQDTFKPHVLMGAADWDMVDKSQNFRDPKPKRDIAAVDGQKVTLGDETITLYLTPGHSPGTLSMLIPVKDHGEPHLAALWGGTGMQTSAEEYNRNARRFREIVTQAGADVMLSTHPQLDKSDVKLRLLEKRQSGDPHPYVVGNDVVRAYLTVATECSAAAQLLPEEYKGYLGRR